MLSAFDSEGGSRCDIARPVSLLGSVSLPLARLQAGRASNLAEALVAERGSDTQAQILLIAAQRCGLERLAVA